MPGLFLNRRAPLIEALTGYVPPVKLSKTPTALELQAVPRRGIPTYTSPAEAKRRLEAARLESYHHAYDRQIGTQPAPVRASKWEGYSDLGAKRKTELGFDHPQPDYIARMQYAPASHEPLPPLEKPYRFVAKPLSGIRVR